MFVSFLKRLQRPFSQARTIHRRVVLGLLGLKTGSSTVIYPKVQWPLFSLKQISIGKRVQIGARSHLFIPADNKSATIEIGDDSILGENLNICALGRIHIGKDCVFSHDIYIADSEHVIGRGIKVRESGIIFRGTVRIGDRCFIGRNATILPGVVLGANCVVGAGSVVTKSFPPNSVIAGIPAKLIREL